MLLLFCDGPVDGPKIKKGGLLGRKISLWILHRITVRFKNNCSRMTWTSELNEGQLKAIVIAPMLTGSISAFSSAALIISIFRSTLKLSTIYRRIIFGISVTDLIQSCSHIFAAFVLPKESGMWAAIGNTTSCEIRGFVSTIASCMAFLYSISLSLYFLLVVKYNESETRIKRKFEPFFHAVPILYSLVVSVYILATRNFNRIGPTCWIAPRPYNCKDDPNVECKSFGNTKILVLISNAFPAILAFFANCFILGVICYTVQEHHSANLQMYNRQSLALPISSPQQEPDQISPLAARLSRPSKAMVQRMKQIYHRAAAYITGFLITYIFAFIAMVWTICTVHYPPFAVIFLARSLFTLQGFFNILIYTHPHVISYRRNHSEYLWIRALFDVVKSGGDSDEIRILRGDRRGSSLRKKEKNQKQVEEEICLEI
jgi:hypothetical protein